jgi:predicted metal-binding membrane protein
MRRIAIPILIISEFLLGAGIRQFSALYDECLQQSIHGLTVLAEYRFA